MADVFNAYKHLAETYKLDLSDIQLARAEHGFRLKFMEELKYRVAPTDQADWEFFTYLGPRKTRSRPDIAAEIHGKKE
jgi:hypothetical protein